MYRNKINVLINIILMGGEGGREVLYFQLIFYLLKKKREKKRVVLNSVLEGKKPLIDQFCWTCNERQFHTMIGNLIRGPVSK